MMTTDQYPNIARHAESNKALAVAVRGNMILRFASHTGGASTLWWKTRQQPDKLFEHITDHLSPARSDTALVTKDTGGWFKTSTTGMQYLYRDTPQADLPQDIVANSNEMLLTWEKRIGFGMVGLTQQGFNESITRPLVLATMCPDDVQDFHELLATTDDQMRSPRHLRLVA